MRFDYYKLEQIQEKLFLYRHSNIFFYPANSITKELLKNVDLLGMNIGIIDRDSVVVPGYTTNAVNILKDNRDAVVFITSSKYEKSIRDDIKKIEEFNGVIETAFFDQTIFPEELYQKDKLCIPRMDLVVTTRCTLRCEKCANLMQYYEHPKDVELTTIIASMENLLKAIDLFGTIYLLGGEPFLYKKLNYVIEYLINSDKICEIIVVTNGTIFPSETNNKLWSTLHHQKVRIQISDYGVLSKNKNAILEQCKKWHINVELDENKFFYDTGNMENRGRTQEELQKVFWDCNTLCRSLYNGEFHYCPRSSHGTDLGIVTKYKDEYVNLLEEKDVNEIKNDIKKFINRNKYIEACNYCDIRLPGYYDKTFPAAVQTTKVVHTKK